MSNKVLVTDDVHPLLLSGLASDGYEVDYFPNCTLQEVFEMIAPYRGIIINSKIIVDKKLIDLAPHLTFIGRLGSGLDIIDLPYAAAKGISVISAPEGNRNAVAEQALGMLLALMNNICRADKEVRQRLWNRETNRGLELSGRTVGIIGCGHTGFAFLNKLSGLGVQVLAYDKYKSYYLEPSQYARESSLEEIQARAEIISLHLPLTEETHHFINDQFINQCQNKVILINTSRGKVVSTATLLKGLDSGQIVGAALDVFENEKPETYSKEEQEQYSKLFERQNVILTPHIAGWTLESKQKIADIVLSRIRAIAV